MRVSNFGLVFFFWFILMGIVLTGQAEENWLIRNFQVQVENSSGEAAKKLGYEQGLLQVTEEMGKDFLGEERFLKNKKIISTRILQNAAKYIPFSKASVVETTGYNHVIRIEVKASPTDFRQLLQEQGLLAQGEAQPVVIPYLTWSDQVKSKNYRWWKDKADTSLDFLLRMERLTESSLMRSFLKNGFYVWRPLEFSLWQQLPSVYQSERLMPEDFEALGSYFNSPLAIDGSVVISAFKGNPDRFQIDLKWTAFLTENGKTVGEVARHFLTEVGPQERVVDKKLKQILDGTSSDLIGQIYEAWQKGRLSARVLRLTFKTPPGMKSQELLKDQIRTNFSMIKAIRERIISRDQLSFEIETTLSAHELMQKMNHFDFEKRKYLVSLEGDSELVLRPENEH